jgi:hypothetical protein
MRVWYDNIKMDIKETRLVFKLNSSLQHGQSGIFGKVNEVILNGNMCLQQFCIRNFLRTD